MATSEAARHDLYRALEEVLGPERATTLMDGLVPIRWHDVATKADLDRFGNDVDARFAKLEGSIEGRFGEVAKEFGLVHKEIGEIHLRIAEWGRTVVLANVATMVAAVSLAFAASRF